MIWRDGVFLDEDPRWLPPVERLGVFTTVGCFGGSPLLWDRHSTRLTGSAHRLFPDVELLLPRLAELEQLLSDNRCMGRARMRVVVVRNDEFGCFVEASATAILGTDPSSGLRLTEMVRPPGAPGHKFLARGGWNEATAEARKQGFDDGLFVDRQGKIGETAVGNVFAVFGNTLVTPPAPQRCLPGVMRGWVLEHAGTGGLMPAVQDLVPGEVGAADEVWVSNAVIGVRPVAVLDAVSWRTWPVLKRFRNLGIPAPLA